MYLSAERVAIVNRTIQQTFEQSCIAWQAIPHWDTGDPGQTEVTNDNLGTVKIVAPFQKIDVTVAQLTAPTPDALLGAVTGAVVTLAADVDAYVFPALRSAAPAVAHVASANPPDILDGLINARVLLENAGFRAPSALFADTVSIKALYQLVNNYAPVKDPLLDAGNINSLYRVNKLVDGVLFPAPTKTLAAGESERAIVLGRRQRIAPGYAAEVLPGDEPVDLAISIGPSFEVVGETSANKITINVRIRYAVRVKDVDGLVLIVNP